MPATSRVVTVAAAALFRLAGASVRDVVAATAAAGGGESADGVRRLDAAAPSDAAPPSPALSAQASEQPPQQELPPDFPWNASLGFNFDDLVALRPAWVNEVILAHNEYRCMHGVPALQWSLPLEAHAKQWVVKGHNQRSPPWTLLNVAGWPRIGESVAYDVTDTGGSQSPVGKVQSWYDAIRYTENGEGKMDNRRYELSEYAQIVWKSTTHFGCALLHDFFVCQYGPAGNEDGQYTSQVQLTQKTYQECRQRW